MYTHIDNICTGSSDLLLISYTLSCPVLFTVKNSEWFKNRTPLIVQLSGFAENRTQKIIYNIKSKTIVKLVLIETLWDQILCLK